MQQIAFSGERLREVRIAAGLRLEDVAALLGIGVTTLHKWEHADLPRARYHGVLRAIGKAYRARHEAYRAASKVAKEAGAA